MGRGACKRKKGREDGRIEGGEEETHAELLVVCLHFRGNLFQVLDSTEAMVPMLLCLL